MMKLFLKVVGFASLSAVFALVLAACPLTPMVVDPQSLLEKIGSIYVNSVEELNAAILYIKKDNIGGRDINLTSKFYNDVNAAREYIKVDPGESANTVPYTIRGLGKNSQSLNVGFWLANNNITLDGVNINLTVSTNNVTRGPWNSVENKYGTGILIARSKNGDERDISHSVTVKNCTVTITGSSSAPFTAGIYVYAWGTNITIDNNRVLAVGNGSNAVQALAFEAWSNNITITNNDLTARYAVWLNRGDYDLCQHPASAIYISNVIDLPWIYNWGVITGNTLTCGNSDNKSLYSFFFNAFRSIERTETDRAGVETLRKANFGNGSTTFALAANTNGGLAKYLTDALIANCVESGNGFGMVIGVIDNTGDSCYEHYNITNGVFKEISLTGYPVNASGTYDLYNVTTYSEGVLTVTGNNAQNYARNNYVNSGYYEYWKQVP